MEESEIIPPGSTLGILGDGQLGRMIAIAAAKLGYRVAVLGPGGRESPTGHVAYWAKAWDANGDVSDELLDEFCKLVRVVMIEWENVPISLVQRIEAKGVPVRPSSKVLTIAQDRLLEKQFAQKLGIPVPYFQTIGNMQEVWDSLRRSLTEYPTQRILKARCNGYDGKGQIRILPGEPVLGAWNLLGEAPCILENVVDYACEISVIVVRSPDTNQIMVYGPFENRHENGVLRITKYPLTHDIVRGSVEDVKRRAVKAAKKLADSLDVHGLLAVEFFVARDGRVLFNEMAPRPHNSGHLTIECCDTSQFEQYVRAVCNLFLGRPDFHSHGAMCNIIGGEAKDWPVLTFRTGSLHLYGKEKVKAGRKMGHVTKRYTICD